MHRNEKVQLQQLNVSTEENTVVFGTLDDVRLSWAPPVADECAIWLKMVCDCSGLSWWVLGKVRRYLELSLNRADMTTFLQEKGLHKKKSVGHCHRTPASIHIINYIFTAPQCYASHIKTGLCVFLVLFYGILLFQIVQHFGQLLLF